MRRRHGRGDSFDDEEEALDDVGVDDDEDSGDETDGNLAPLRSSLPVAAAMHNVDGRGGEGTKNASQPSLVASRGWYTFPHVDSFLPLCHEDTGAPYAPGCVGLGVGVASVGTFDRGMHGAGFTLGVMGAPSSTVGDAPGGMLYLLQDTRGAVLPVSAGNGGLPLPSEAFPRGRPGVPQLVVAGYMSESALLIGASHIARVLESITSQVFTASCAANVVEGRRAAADALYGLLQSANKLPVAPAGGRGGDSGQRKGAPSRRSISGWDAIDDADRYSVQLFPAKQRGITLASTFLRRMHGSFAKALPDLHVSRVAWLIALNSTAAAAAVLSSLQEARDAVGLVNDMLESAADPLRQAPSESEMLEGTGTLRSAAIQPLQGAERSPQAATLSISSPSATARRSSLPNALLDRIPTAALPLPPAFIVEGRMRPNRGSKSPPQRADDAAPARATSRQGDKAGRGIFDSLVHPLGTDASPGFFRTAMRSLHAHVLVQPETLHPEAVPADSSAARGSSGGAGERVMRKSASVEASLHSLSSAQTAHPVLAGRDQGVSSSIDAPTSAATAPRGPGMSATIQKLVAVFSAHPAPVPSPILQRSVTRGALATTPTSAAPTPGPAAAPTASEPREQEDLAAALPTALITRAVPLAPGPSQPSGLTQMLKRAASERARGDSRPPLANAPPVPSSPMLAPSTPKSSSYVGDVLGFFSRARTNSRAAISLAPIGEEAASAASPFPSFAPQGTPIATPRRNLLGNESEHGASAVPSLVLGSTIVSTAAAASIGLLSASSITHVLDDDRAADWIEGELDDRGVPLASGPLARSIRGLSDAEVMDEAPSASVGGAAMRSSTGVSDGGVHVLAVLAALHQACTAMMPDVLPPRVVEGSELLVPPSGLLSSCADVAATSSLMRELCAPTWPAFQSTVGAATDASRAFLPPYDRTGPTATARPSVRPFLSHIVRCQVSCLIQHVP